MVLSPPPVTHLDFRTRADDRPGNAWRAVFARAWPAWRAWYVARGGARTPDLDAALRAMRRHMPEMESLWARLVAEADADETAARFLTFWQPPRYLVGCSQAVLVDRAGPLLIRNYDLDPALSESTLLASRWRERCVVGMVEGMAGLSDGMNDAGLALSLTFGGRPVSGPGFGVPLILRYVLEVCTDLTQAVEALRCVPCHMSYNVTVVDAQARWATVFLAPDRPSIVREDRATTNHQLGVEWPRHGRVSNTLARARHLAGLLEDPGLDGSRLAEAFLTSPLFSAGYEAGFGTVYTAAYRPAHGAVELLWPGAGTGPCTFHTFPERELRVAYSARGSRVVDATVNG